MAAVERVLLVSAVFLMAWAAFGLQLFVGKVHACTAATCCANPADAATCVVRGGGSGGRGANGRRGRTCRLLPARLHAPARSNKELAQLQNSCARPPRWLCPAPAYRRCKCKRSAWAAAPPHLTTRAAGHASGPPGPSISTSEAHERPPVPARRHCVTCSCSACPQHQGGRARALWRRRPVVAHCSQCLSSGAPAAPSSPLGILQHVECSHLPVCHDDWSGVGGCHAARRRRQRGWPAAAAGHVGERAVQEGGRHGEGQPWRALACFLLLFLCKGLPRAAASGTPCARCNA